jgi:hypothetical protein
MKFNYWKIATISLVVVLIWFAYSARPAAAQYGNQTLHITTIKYSDFLSGVVSVPGDVKGFSCAADVDGRLESGNGHIQTTGVDCYVLSK